MGKIKEFVYAFTHITTLVVLATAIYIAVFWGKIEVESYILWQILGVSFICSLVALFKEKEDASKKQTILLLILRYLYVNIVVLTSGFLFEWFYFDNVFMVIGMLIMIAVVYLVISVWIYYKEKATADKMTVMLTEKLQERQKEPTAELEKQSE